MSSSPKNPTCPYLFTDPEVICFDPIQRLRRQLFLMWLFVSQEGILDESREFVLDHTDEAFPFEFDI